jgi:hypothetical protein
MKVKSLYAGADEGEEELEEELEDEDQKCFDGTGLRFSDRVSFYLPTQPPS